MSVRARKSTRQKSQAELTVFEILDSKRAYKNIDDLPDDERDMEEKRISQLRTLTKAVVRLQRFYLRIRPVLEERKRRKRVLQRTRDGFASVEFQLAQEERRAKERDRVEKEKEEAERAVQKRKVTFGKTGRVGWNSAKGRPYRPLSKPVLDLKVVPTKVGAHKERGRERREASAEPVFDIEPSKPQSSLVLQERYKYYRAGIYKARQKLTIRLEVEEGDADLVASAGHQYPSLSNGKYTWKSMGEGDDIIVIKPDDPDYIVGDIFIGVYGLEPVNRFKLSVSLHMERVQPKDVIPFDAIRQALNLSSSRVKGMRAGLPYKTAIEREAHVLRLKEQREWEQWQMREKEVRRRKGLTGESHGKFGKPPFLLSGRRPATSESTAADSGRKEYVGGSVTGSRLPSATPLADRKQRPGTAAPRVANDTPTRKNAASSPNVGGAKKEKPRPFSALMRNEQEDVDNGIDAMLRLRVTSGLLEAGANQGQPEWALPGGRHGGKSGESGVNTSLKEARSMAGSMLSRFEQAFEIGAREGEEVGEGQERGEERIESARLTAAVGGQGGGRKDNWASSPLKKRGGVRESWNDRQMLTVARSTQALAITSINTARQMSGQTGVTDSGIITFAAKCRKVEYANFSFCAHLSSKILTEGAAKSWPFLSTLILRDCTGIGDSGLVAVSSRCHSLQHVDVGGCRRVTDKATTSLVKNLRLLSLNLTSTRISDITLTAIAEMGESMEVLVLAGCRDITRDGVLKICAACSTLRFLSLAGVACIDNFCIQTLFSTAPSLEALNVALCARLTDEMIEDPNEDMVKLPPFFRQLNITGCRRITDACISKVRTRTGCSLWKWWGEREMKLGHNC